VQYWLSAGRGETNLVLVFDSGHYQESANLLVSFLAHGTAAGDKEALVKALMLDGPVLPGLAALTFLSFGRLLGAMDWQCLLGLQAFLHGLSAVLVFFVGRHLLLTSPSSSDSSPDSRDSSVGSPTEEPSLNSATRSSSSHSADAGRNWALAAGLLWAVNPVAVLSSQRFLSEILTADLLLLLLLVCCSLKTPRLSSPGLICRFLLLGLTAALILFTKAALMPVTAVLVLVMIAYLWKTSSDGSPPRMAATTKILACAATALGMACVIVPWAAFTRYACGEAHYFPQRAPALNLFVGWNFDTDGFSTLPIAPLSKPLQESFNQSNSAPLAVMEVWRRSPVQSLSLAMEKVARLYGLPWNDFRRTALGFSPRLQLFLHQICLFFALAAFIIGVARGAAPAFWLAAVLATGHLIFILFEAVPRYAFSSYPFLFLMALYAVRLLRGLSWQRKHIGLAVFAVVVALALFNINLPLAWIAQRPAQDRFISLSLLLIALVVLLCLALGRALPLALKPARKISFIGSLGAVALFYGLVQMCYAMTAPDRGEWLVKLGPGGQAERTFNLPAQTQAPSSALVVIDAVRRIGDCRVTVNGQALQSKPVDICDFMPQRKEHFQFAQQVAAFMGRSPEDIRRWWAVPVPLSALRFNQPNTITLSVPQGVQVRLYGEGSQHDESSGRRPGYLYVSPGKVWTSNSSFEWREGRPLGPDTLGGQCSLSTDGGGKLSQAGHFRLFLLTVGEADQAHALETAAVQVF
jgi:hypothetical protein